MDVSPLTSGLGSTGQQTDSGSSDSSFAGDFNTFLTLLTEQLQNQDPLDPTDTNQFTRQLADFAGVEQQIQTNDKLDRLADQAAFDRVNQAVNFIGKDAKIASDTGQHDGDGITFSLKLDERADSASVEVVNSDGETVYEGDAPTSAGEHEHVWSGLTDSGEPAPTGQYSLRVNAQDSDGNAISTDVFVTDSVSEVTTDGQTPQLTVAGQQVSLDEILAVREP